MISPLVRRKKTFFPLQLLSTWFTHNLLNFLPQGKATGSCILLKENRYEIVKCVLRLVSLTYESQICNNAGC